MTTEPMRHVRGLGVCGVLSRFGAVCRSRLGSLSHGVTLEMPNRRTHGVVC